MSTGLGLSCSSLDDAMLQRATMDKVYKRRMLKAPPHIFDKPRLYTRQANFQHILCPQCGKSWILEDRSDD